MTRNARWYVYELIDPRDGLAFYVGKGSGNRIAEHERDAKREGVCSEKINKIKEIWDDGLSVKRQHVAFFWDEQAAYDYEAIRVAEYGLEALTNIICGGGTPKGSFIRRSPAIKPWTPEIAANQLLSTKAGNTLYWFAYWLKLRSAGKSHQLQGPKISLAILEVAFNVTFPRIWDLVTTSRDALVRLAPHLAKHGVELEYGRA